ncbi:MAG: hypothetical protein ACYC0V_07775 [Armatimonadota bacterium]
MSCYLKHMEEIIIEAGIELTKENRKAVDHAIRRAIGKPDSRCPEVWKEIKAQVADGRKQEIVDNLKLEFIA